MAENVSNGASRTKRKSREENDAGNEGSGLAKSNQKVLHNYIRKLVKGMHKDNQIDKKSVQGLTKTCYEKVLSVSHGLASDDDFLNDHRKKKVAKLVKDQSRKYKSSSDK